MDGISLLFTFRLDSIYNVLYYGFFELRKAVTLIMNKLSVRLNIYRHIKLSFMSRVYITVPGQTSRLDSVLHTSVRSRSCSGIYAYGNDVFRFDNISDPDHPEHNATPNRCQTG
eukprot:93421_1